MTLAYDNIFDAITDDEVAASELQTRSDLMIVIRHITALKPLLFSHRFSNQTNHNHCQRTQ